MENCSQCSEPIYNQTFNFDNSINCCCTHYVCLLDYLAITGYQNNNGVRGWKCPCGYIFEYFSLLATYEQDLDKFQNAIRESEDDVQHYEERFNLVPTAVYARALGNSFRESREIHFNVQTIHQRYSEIFRQYSNFGQYIINPW